MITAISTPASHAGEDQSSPEFAARSAHWQNTQAGIDASRAQYWSINHPTYDATSLTELVVGDNYKNDWLRAGDVVYVAEIRRHVLTDADLDAAARAVIGGAA